MDKVILKAEKRSGLGRRVKKIRSSGILPANIYGKKVKSESVQVVTKDLFSVFGKVGETGLVELQIDKDKKPVLIHNIQRHPVSDEPLHVEFLQVDLKEKVTTKVPVELVGESPAEKQSLGTVVQYLNEIEVEALPEDLISSFEVNVSTLTEVDQAVQVKDLKYDSKKITINTLEDEIVVKVEPPKKEEEVVAAAPAEVVEGVAPAAEGEAPSTVGSEKEGPPQESPKE